MDTFSFIIFWGTIYFYPRGFYYRIIGKSLKFHNRKSLKFNSILQAVQTDFFTRLSFLRLKKGKRRNKPMKTIIWLLIISIVHCFAKCFSSGIPSKVSRVFFCLLSFSLLFKRNDFVPISSYRDAFHMVDSNAGPDFRFLY